MTTHEHGASADRSQDNHPVGPKEVYHARAAELHGGGDAALDPLWRRKARRKPKIASLLGIREELLRTRQLMLTARTDEALAAIARIEAQLDDLPPADAERLKGAAFVQSLISPWTSQRADDCPARRCRIAGALTVRECDILAMMGQGFSNKHIARSLAISPETVKSHAKRIFAKLAVRSRAEAVSRAGPLGLLDRADLPARLAPTPPDTLPS